MVEIATPLSRKITMHTLACPDFAVNAIIIKNNDQQQDAVSFGELTASSFAKNEVEKAAKKFIPQTGELQ